MMEKREVLVVARNARCRVMAEELARGWIVQMAHSSTAASKLLCAGPFAAVVADYRIADGAGWEYLAAVRTTWPEVKTVLLAPAHVHVPADAESFIDHRVYDDGISVLGAALRFTLGGPA